MFQLCAHGDAQFGTHVNKDTDSLMYRAVQVLEEFNAIQKWSSFKKALGFKESETTNNTSNGKNGRSLSVDLRDEADFKLLREDVGLDSYNA